ncbi:MAG: hypothetical protein ACE3JK_14405 [Sporolactobacillus sp.]
MGKARSVAKISIKADCAENPHRADAAHYKDGIEILHEVCQFINKGQEPGEKITFAGFIAAVFEEMKDAGKQIKENIINWFDGK